jgi:molybdopterin/thiamine biosynthesis adenylyltransferase
MAGPPERFAPIDGRVDVGLLARRLVVIVGVGTVGSQVAGELANCGVGRMRFLDGDSLEITNLVRHLLPSRYVGRNKAEALTLYLAGEVPTLMPEAVPRYVDASVSDRALDSLLRDADLVIAATDDREAQRRVGRRALALDIPAIFPALYGDNGGEVFVQLDPSHPCFLCWDGYRPADERLRGVTALNSDTLPVLQLAVRLSLALLDPSSEFNRLLAGPRHDPRLRQLFIARSFAALSIAAVPRRPNCPSCAVGPASPAGPPPPTSPRSPLPRPGLTIPHSTTVHAAPSTGRIVVVVLLLAWAILGVIAIASKHSSPSASSQRETTSGTSHATPPQPVSTSLPARASEGFDVAPTFASAGSLSEEEHPDGKVLRQLTLDAELEGPLLKVTVNSSYTAADAASLIAYAKEHDEPASLEQIVGRTCARVTVWNSGHEDEGDDLVPVNTHLEQHGLDVAGTLLYPAVLPGEYEWGCAEPYRLGNLTTPNLGDADGDVVFKVHPATTDTLVIIGLHGSTNINEYNYGRVLHEPCIVPAQYGAPYYRPSYVRIYQTWAPNNGPPYIVAGLTFPIGTAHIEHDDLYPGCVPSGEEGVTLTSSSQAAPSYEFREEPSASVEG